MTTEKNRYLTKGVRDCCTRARSLCAKLELHCGDVTEALERSFGPFLGDHDLEAGSRRLTLSAIDAIRQRIARLLDLQWVVHELDVQCSEDHERKNQAIAGVHRMLTSFRKVDLWDRGPVVPRGKISWRPEQLLLEAARVRPHLDSPHLQLSSTPFPGFEPAPGLGTELDAAVNELETALAEFQQSQVCCAEAREERDLALNGLRDYVTSMGKVLRALLALRQPPNPPVPAHGD